MLRHLLKERIAQVARNRRVKLVSVAVLAVLIPVAGILTYLSELIGDTNRLEYSVDLRPDNYRSAFSWYGVGVTWDHHQGDNLIRNGEFDSFAAKFSAPVVYKTALGPELPLNIKPDEIPYTTRLIGGKVRPMHSQHDHEQSGSIIGINPLIFRQPHDMEIEYEGEIKDGAFRYNENGGMSDCVWVGSGGLVIYHSQTTSSEIISAFTDDDLVQVVGNSAGYLARSGRGEVWSSSDGQHWQKFAGASKIDYMAASATEFVLLNNRHDLTFIDSNREVHQGKFSRDLRPESTVCFQQKFLTLDQQGRPRWVKKAGDEAWPAANFVPNIVPTRTVVHGDNLFMVSSRGEIEVGNFMNGFRIVNRHPLIENPDVQAVLAGKPFKIEQMIVFSTDKLGFVLAEAGLWAYDVGRDELKQLQDGLDSVKRAMLLPGANFLTVSADRAIIRYQLTAGLRLKGDRELNNIQAGDRLIISRNLKPEGVPLFWHVANGTAKATGYIQSAADSNSSYDNYLELHPKRANRAEQGEQVTPAEMPAGGSFGGIGNGSVAVDVVPGAGFAAEEGEADANAAEHDLVLQQKMVLNGNNFLKRRVYLLRLRAKLLDEDVGGGFTPELSVRGGKTAAIFHLSNLSNVWQTYEFKLVSDPDFSGKETEFTWQLRTAHSMGIDNVYFGLAENNNIGTMRTEQLKELAPAPSLLRLNGLNIGRNGYPEFSWLTKRNMEAWLILNNKSFGAVAYTLYDGLALAESLRTNVWLVINPYVSAEEIDDLLEYLVGSVYTGKGEIRRGQGHPAPWALSFKRIFIEVADEDGGLLSDRDRADSVDNILRKFKISSYYQEVKNKLFFVDGMNYNKNEKLSAADEHATALTAGFAEGLSAEDVYHALISIMPRQGYVGESGHELISEASLEAINGKRPRLAKLAQIVLAGKGKVLTQINYKLPLRHEAAENELLGSLLSIYQAEGNGLHRISIRQQPEISNIDTAVREKIDAFGSVGGDGKVSLIFTNNSSIEVNLNLKFKQKEFKLKETVYDGNGKRLASDSFSNGDFSLKIPPDGVITLNGSLPEN